MGNHSEIGGESQRSASILFQWYQLGYTSALANLSGAASSDDRKQMIDAARVACENCHFGI